MVVADSHSRELHRGDRAFKAMSDCWRGGVRESAEGEALSPLIIDGNHARTRDQHGAMQPITRGSPVLRSYTRRQGEKQGAEEAIRA